MRRERERGQIFAILFGEAASCARVRSERKLERRAGECERPSTEVRLPPSPNPSCCCFSSPPPLCPLPSAFLGSVGPPRPGGFERVGRDFAVGS